MLDGAALGTLIIGLEHAREASDRSPTPARRPARRSRRPSMARVRLANVLRSAADRVDGATSAGLDSSSTPA
jgi:hypothetical protein